MLQTGFCHVKVVISWFCKWQFMMLQSVFWSTQDWTLHATWRRYCGMVGFFINGWLRSFSYMFFDSQRPREDRKKIPSEAESRRESAAGSGQRQSKPRAGGIHPSPRRGGSGSSPCGPPWPRLPPRRRRPTHSLGLRTPTRKTSGVSNRDAPSSLDVLAYR